MSGIDVTVSEAVVATVFGAGGVLCTWIKLRTKNCPAVRMVAECEQLRKEDSAKNEKIYDRLRELESKSDSTGTSLEFIKASLNRIEDKLQQQEVHR